MIAALVENTRARLRWWYVCASRPVTSVAWITVVDARGRSEAPVEALCEVLGKALDLLREAGCDVPVREMVRGIMLIDDERWKLHGFGVCEASLTGPFSSEAPAAMRLLWTAVWVQCGRNVMRAGRVEDALVLHSVAYEAVDLFASHLTDAQRWRQYARNTFGPENACNGRTSQQ